MSYVLMMLSSEWKLPRPKKPGFFVERDVVSDNSPLSNNELTATQLNSLHNSLMESQTGVDKKQVPWPCTSDSAAATASVTGSSLSSNGLSSYHSLHA
ncbi:hypothetical protein AHAS_Ahas18G0123000 [Arachis hypogaea]